MYIDFKVVITSGKSGKRKGEGNGPSMIFILQCFISLKKKSEENVAKLIS